MKRSTWRNGRIWVRKHIFAAIKFVATFLCEVEDLVENLVEMEEVTEEMKQKPKWPFDHEERGI